MKQFIRMEEGYFHICKFTTEEQLYIYARNQNITCLLISEEYEGKIEERKIGAKYYFYLTQDSVKSRVRKKQEKVGRQSIYVYRFQSAEQIFNQILDRISREQDLNVKLIQERVEAQIVGVYNPVHRNGQTTYAKALAISCAERGAQVLYLNLEELSGVEFEEQRGRDLGEVLYYLKQDIKSIHFRLASFVKSENGYDWVPPMEMSEELKKITTSEWYQFLQAIKEKSGYEIIILDLDSCIQGLIEVLESCDSIHMPIRVAQGGEKKREQFLNNLRKMEKQELISKISYREIPEFHHNLKEEYAKIFRTAENDSGTYGLCGIHIR